MKTNRVTVAQLKAIIEGDMENDPIPGKIRDFLVAHDGKKLTRHYEKKMQETIDPSIRFRQVGTILFNIEWTPPKQGSIGSITLDSWAVDMKKTVTRWRDGREVELNRFDDANTAYFAARDERNEQRRKALADEKTLALCADAINQRNAATEMLKLLTEYGAPLNVVRYDFEKLYTDK